MASVFQTHHIARALAGAESDCVLATLVRVDGSSYRRPGASMLILPNRRAVGGITAGCLEEDIRQCAFDWTRGGPCVKAFSTGSAADDALGWGSGCKGTLHVLLERIAPDYPAFRKLTQALAGREAVMCATVFESDPHTFCRLARAFFFPGTCLYADNPSAAGFKTRVAAGSAQRAGPRRRKSSAIKLRRAMSRCSGNRFSLRFNCVSLARAESA